MPALDTVAWIYSVAALFCFVDIFLARGFRRALRFFEAIALAIVAFLYAHSYVAGDTIPPVVTRWAWIALAPILIGEVISLWRPFVGKQKQ